MNKRYIGALLAVAMLSTSCAWINKDKKALKDYRQAKLDKPLTIPEGLSSQAISDFYAIPPVNVGLVDKNAEVPEPPALSLADENNLVRIQKFDGESWVLVQLVPGQVWPLISQYATDNGIPIAREQAAQGFIETVWLQKQTDAGMQEKYRFIVRQGIQRNSTEIDILQQQAPKGTEQKRLAAWSGAQDPNSADTTLKSLAEYLASYADPTAPVSLRAQNIDTSPRISLKADGNPRVLVKVDTSKGFATAQFAIGKSQFDVTDINISEGLIYAKSQLKPKGQKKISRLLGISRRTVWPNHEFIFTFKASTQQPGWQVLNVESNKKLSTADKKAILKQVKRNFS